MTYYKIFSNTKNNWILLYCYILAIMPILAANYFPLIDFYNHAARYYILANVADVSTLQDYYAPDWRILPNIGLDIIALALFKMFQPFVAAKLILLLLISATFFGFYTLGKHFKSPIYVCAPVAALLSHSYILGWGFTNFLLGISFACFLITKIIDPQCRYNKEGYSLHIIAACVLLLLHGYAFFLFGVISICLLIGKNFSEIKNLKSSLYKDLVRLAGLSILPLMLFAASSTSKLGGAMGLGIEKIETNYSEMPILQERLMNELLYRIEVSFRVMESGFIPFDIIMSCTLLLVFAGLLFKKCISISKQYYFLIATLSLFWIFIPPTLFNVGYVAERIPLLIFLTVAISFRVTANRFFVAFFLILFATVHSLATALYWNKSSGYYDEFIHEIQSLASQKTIAIVSGFKHNGRDDNFPRCHPLPHLAFLEKEMYASIFSKYGEQPIVMRGELANMSNALNAVKINRFNPKHISFQQKLDVAIDQNFDYIIICGDNWLDLDMTNKVELVSSASYFKIVKVNY